MSDERMVNLKFIMLLSMLPITTIFTLSMFYLSVIPIAKGNGDLTNMILLSFLICSLAVTLGILWILPRSYLLMVDTGGHYVLSRSFPNSLQSRETTIQ